MASHPAVTPGGGNFGVLRLRYHGCTMVPGRSASWQREPAIACDGAEELKNKTLGLCKRKVQCAPSSWFFVVVSLVRRCRDLLAARAHVRVPVLSGWRRLLMPARLWWRTTTSRCCRLRHSPERFLHRETTKVGQRDDMGGRSFIAFPAVALHSYTRPDAFVMSMALHLSLPDASLPSPRAAAAERPAAAARGSPPPEASGLLHNIVSCN